MYSPFSVVRLAIFRAVGKSGHLWAISNSSPFIGAGFASISEKNGRDGGKIAPAAHPTYAGLAILR